MKKILLSLLLLGATINFAQARFFVGVDGGYSLDHLYKYKNNKIVESAKGDGFNIGLNLGTEHYFGQSEIVGLRWLLMGGYGQNFIENITLHLSNFNVNLALDLLIDVIKFDNDSALTLFGGLQGGLLGILSKEMQEGNTSLRALNNQNLFSFQGRVGLSLRITKHHRFEFSFYTPVYSFYMFSDTPPNAFANNIKMTLGYKFLF
ncbi:outer membrane protein [Helicobacter mustelae]|uniref:outer membrane beta-barrel protein n=1 Tax=Helicobacter mustelae TaxID=217 RepID=UPI000E015004|nr:outer membrane beta-barrel protein [Helicobacter mustelae]STP11917.1 outer membrane protein [Helicobacter mustelae]